MSNRNGSGPTLRITDCSDRELLALLYDLQGQEGWVDVHDLASQFWPQATRDPESNEALHARQCVSIRLGHMRVRAGLVEKHETERRHWRVADEGVRYLQARLKVSTERLVLGADETQLPELVGLVGSRYHALGTVSAWLVRREWQYQTARR